MATKFESVDGYIAAQPETARAALEQVRSAIGKGVPGAEETISYNIPAYKVNGKVVIYFAGWKKHYSLYPAGENLVAAFNDDLAPFEVEKGTIRFPLAGAVPVKLIAKIAKFRTNDAVAQKAQR